MKERIQGIDLLRIIAMLMIIVSHLSFHGARNYLVLGSINRIIFDCLMLGNLGVVIFMLISGYFYEQKFKLKKLAKLIVNVEFYSVILYFISLIFNHNSLQLKEFLKVVLPINSYIYWFITVYILIYLFSPFIKKLINTLSKKQFNFFLLIYFLIFIFSYFFFNYIYEVNMYMNDFTELLFYYLLGAYIYKYKPKIFDEAIFKIGGGSSVLITIISIITLNKLQINNTTILLARNSIFVIIIAINLFNIFRNINIDLGLIKKITPHILSVYLIHDNPFIRTILWQKIFSISKYCNSFKILFFIPFIIVTIFAFCILIDIISSYIIDKLIFKNYKFLDKKEENLTNLLYESK